MINTFDEIFKILPMQCKRNKKRKFRILIWIKRSHEAEL